MSLLNISYPNGGPKTRIKFECWSCRQFYSLAATLDGQTELFVSCPFCDNLSVADLVIYSRDDKPIHSNLLPQFSLNPDSWWDELLILIVRDKSFTEDEVKTLNRHRYFDGSHLGILQDEKDMLVIWGLTTELSSRFIVAGDYYQSLEFAKRATLLSNGMEERPAISGSLLLEGRSFMGLQGYDNALQNFEKAIALARDHTTEVNIARLTLLVSYCLDKLGQSLQAKHRLSSIINLLKDNETLFELAKATFHLARLNLNLKEMDIALRLFRDALRYYERLNNDIGMARCQEVIGRLHVQMFGFDGLDVARKRYAIALDLYSQHDFLEDQKRIEKILGRLS